MSAGEFQQLAKKLDAVASEFDGRQLRKSLETIGQQTKADIDQAVHGALGDDSMSGWRRKKPIPIKGQYQIVGDHEIDMTPQGRAIGPMRVLEQGRNANAFGAAYGGAVSRALAEPKFNKNGTRRKQRARQVKRWNGVTRGKGVWSKASENMAKNVPGRIHQEIVVGALTRHIGKG